jgi:2OG-Fe(II) oxygenase superfamily
MVVVDKVEYTEETINTDIFYENNTTQPSAFKLDGCDAFVIEDLFSLKECEWLMKSVEKVGFTFWNPYSETSDEFRRAFTVEVKHTEIASIIFTRISGLLSSKIWPNNLLVDVVDAESVPTDSVGTWKAVGINTRLLFSRYLDGGHFAPHSDGYTEIDLNNRSLYTCVIYLDDAIDGGQTVLYSNDQIEKPLVKDACGRLTGDPSLVLHRVEAKRGRMLVFNHSLFHEGSPAKQKNIIRTDIMFTRTPAICTDPEDLEAYKIYMEAQRISGEGNSEEALTLFKKAFRLSPNLKKFYRM